MEFRLEILSWQKPWDFEISTISYSRSSRKSPSLNCVSECQRPKLLLRVGILVTRQGVGSKKRKFRIIYCSFMFAVMRAYLGPDFKVGLSMPQFNLDLILSIAGNN